VRAARAHPSKGLDVKTVSGGARCQGEFWRAARRWLASRGELEAAARVLRALRPDGEAEEEAAALSQDFADGGGRCSSASDSWRALRCRHVQAELCLGAPCGSRSVAMCSIASLGRSTNGLE
jgi:hypothetical protein